MHANTKASSLDHAMQVAHAWVNAVAKEFDTEDREFAYGPANGLPATTVGTFSQKLMDEAKTKGWAVISMKNDWKRIFAWE